MTIPVQFGMGPFGAFGKAATLPAAEVSALLAFAPEPAVTRWPFAARLAVISGGAVLGWVIVLVPALWIAARLH